MRVDKTRQHPLARRVDHLGLVRYRETGALDRDDLSRVEQNSSAVDGLAFYRDDPRPDDRLAISSNAPESSVRVFAANVSLTGN
jgi:hypothetical protein